MENLGFIFGIVGMSMGVTGFVFSIVSMKRMDKLESLLKENDVINNDSIST